MLLPDITRKNEYGRLKAVSTNIWYNEMIYIYMNKTYIRKNKITS